MKAADQGSHTLQEILTEMGAESRFERPPTGPVAKEKVQNWMTSREVEALGATYVFISEPKHYARIRPPLNFQESFQFTKNYYERCFLENPDGKWTNNRYEAGWDLVNWFASQWNDPEIPRSALEDLKKWMARLYKAGDSKLRRCLVDATLEHLFEQRKFRRFFSDWKNDPVLRVAHDEALEWVQGGGSTPLGKPEGFKLLSGGGAKQKRR